MAYVERRLLADVHAADLIRQHADNRLGSVYAVSGLPATRLLQRVKKELVHDKMLTMLYFQTDEPQTYW